MFLWSTHRAKFIYYIRCFAWVIYIACDADQAGPTKRPLSIGIVVRSNLAHAKNRHHHHQKPGIQLFCAEYTRFHRTVYSNCVHSHNSFDTLTHTATVWYLNEPIWCVRIANIFRFNQFCSVLVKSGWSNKEHVRPQHKMRVKMVSIVKWA